MPAVERDPPGLEAMVERARALDPGLWATVDQVAGIIDPGAFATFTSTTDAEGAARPPTVRQRYQRARARQRAWAILRLLGHAPARYDWARLFEAMAQREDGT